VTQTCVALSMGL